jgi:hypothetical protein
MNKNESICRKCFHSYVCEQFNEHRVDDNQKCHFYNDHFVSTVDVVKVVRCKDCKFSRPRNKSEKNIYFEGVLICKSCQMADGTCAVCDDDFCSYGELKEREPK